MAQTIRIEENDLSHGTCERSVRKHPTNMKEFLVSHYISSRAWLRIAAVAHLIIALTVLLALTRMDNTQVQAAAAYMWAFLAVLLAVGTFTSDKEEQ